MSWSNLLRRSVPAGQEGKSGPWPFFRSFAIDVVRSLLVVPRLQPPSSLARRLLVYLHSGEVVRDFLPKMFRMFAIMGLMGSVTYWLLSWPAIYHGFERWGLIKAFLAQMMILFTLFLASRVTLLRAGHLRMVPADDFIILRTTTVFCRWLAEFLAVLVVGIALSYFLQPYLIALPFGVDPGTDSTLVGALGVMVAAASVAAVLPIFLFLYSIATVVELGLALEFNTRRDRAGREAL